MTSPQSEPASIPKEFCSVLSRGHGEDPIGTAACHQRYLLVEVPLPWEHNVRHSRCFPRGLAELLEQCADQVDSFRFLAFTSDVHRSPAGHVRVFSFSRPAIPSSCFDKQEYIVPERDLNGLVEAILRKTDTLSRFAAFLQPSTNTRELFVCTHGSHDTCCGKFGYPIYQHINEQHANHGTVRAWRTSHFGGHRYAPTLIDFPEGRYWAHMTTDLLDRLITRHADVSRLALHYRGWGMWNTFEQAAERELLKRFGWDWLHYQKRSACELIDSDTAVVRISYESPDHTVTGTFETEVYVSGKVQSGGCGYESSEVKQYKLRPYKSG